MKLLKKSYFVLSAGSPLTLREFFIRSVLILPPFMSIFGGAVSLILAFWLSLFLGKLAGVPFFFFGIVFFSSLLYYPFYLLTALPLIALLCVLKREEHFLLLLAIFPAGVALLFAVFQPQFIWAVILVGYINFFVGLIHYKRSKRKGYILAS